MGRKLCVVSKERQLRDIPMWKRKQLENQQKPKFHGPPKRENNVVPLGGRLYRERQNSFITRLKNKIQKGK